MAVVNEQKEEKEPLFIRLRATTLVLEENSISFHVSIPISFDRSLLRTYDFRADGLAANEFSSSSLVGKGDREIPQVVPSTANACVCSFRLVRCLSAVSLARGNACSRRSRNRSYARENPIFSTGSLNLNLVNREALPAFCI